MSSLALAEVVSKNMADEKLETIITVLMSDKQELPANGVTDRVTAAVDRALANGGMPA